MRSRIVERTQMSPCPTIEQEHFTLNVEVVHCLKRSPDKNVGDTVSINIGTRRECQTKPRIRRSDGRIMERIQQRAVDATENKCFPS
jgi:hypothetical protein